MFYVGVKVGRTLMVLENGSMWKIFEPTRKGVRGSWRKLHSEELQ
jgi:hypothetical protein